MALPLLPIPLLIVAVFLLLRAETRRPRHKPQIKLWKPLSTALVILIAILSFTQPMHVPLYSALVLIGLVLSLVGDWLLIDSDERPRLFVAGLSAFLLAHVAYIAAFAYAQIVRRTPFDLNRAALAAAVLAIIGMVLYFYLHPSLGNLRQPVLLYMTVISLMVHQAFSGVQLGGSLLAQPALAMGGALLFYMSDLMLAINKFVFDGEGEHNTIWVLSTYYCAQLFIALSASFVR
ncbi:MAG: lysoplasmalogenase [Thermoflexales bacterium]|nr:lysoplasmalogenase [Thermoflexales bacterium]MDW8351244.1 lysoplasmalogenase [Anaerolineae bacterium]